ncbi:MAG: tRNA pseudouridine(55) synthase TruB [Gammaproteobacteria bacterium]|nr:tRNA pseudouridine(55) synthase TruB [Gammaproteobacteria bacterium]
MSRRKSRGRLVSGILLLNKPLEMSSNKALQIVKHLFNAAKAGHTGSLDPLATGMLPICLGEATKVSQYLLEADKVYQVSFKLGERTATGDAEGEIVETKSYDLVTEKQINEVIPEFLGDLEQIPPMYSALKHDGQRLYDLARQGVEVERKSRHIHISEIELLSFEQGVVELKVACSKGTYIRTLAEDMARALNTVSYVTKLHRLEVGSFSDYPMVTLEELRRAAEEGEQQLDKKLLPLDIGIMTMPELKLNDDLSYYMCLGQPVQVPNAPAKGLVRLYNDKRFLGIGEINSVGLVAPKRLMSTQVKTSIE